MFTLNQINDIHRQLGKKATLHKYLLALNAIGIDTYDSFITDGHSEYFGENNQTVVSPPEHEKITIADSSDKDELLKHLNLHNEGKTSYLQMAQGLAESGVVKWSFDTHEMTITYYAVEGHSMLVESIS